MKISPVSRVLHQGSSAGIGLLVLMFSFMPSVLMPQTCPGGSGGGTGPTLLTITVNGDATDWSAVLANPLQVTLDGEFSPACNVAPVDKDCTANTNIKGRDLGRFSWTFDSANVYMYLSRYGSSTNTQTYYFYCDTNGDQRMNAGEKVFQVRFSGSTRRTDAYLYDYNAVDAANGDAMVCPAGPCSGNPLSQTGYADGYTMPGTLGNEVMIYYDITGGWSDGSGFEARVPWTDLGVAAGTGIYYHVSSCNTSNPAQVPASIDDNLGGPNGGIGSFGFYLVSVTPDYTASVAPGSPTVVDYLHAVTNTGTFSDRYELFVHSSLGFRADLYRNADMTLMATDLNGDGDFTDAGEYMNPVFDGDADNKPETSILSPGGAFGVLLRLTAPAGTEGVEDTTLLEAVSMGSVSCLSDWAIDTTAVGSLLLTPSPQGKAAMAGQAVDYGLRLTNHTLADVFDLRIPNTLAGWQVQIFTDPNGDGIPADGVLAATDVNGNGVYTDIGDSITSGYDANANGRPDFGIVANGGTRDFVVRVTVSGGEAVGTINISTVYVNGAAYGEVAQAVLTTTVYLRLTLLPEYTMASGTNKYSGDDRSVFFAHTLINAWPAVDNIALSGASSHTYPVRFWTDPDGDGNPSDGTLITGPVPLAPNGGTLFFVCEVILPAIPATSFPLLDSTTVTAVSGLSPSTSVQVTDQVRVSYLSVWADSNHTIARTVYAQCQIIHIMGSSLVASTTTQYSFTYSNPSGTVVRNVTVPTTGDGDAFDSYTFASTDARGTWTLRLYDSGTLLDTVTVILDPATTPSTIGPLTTGQASYAVSGDNLAVTATFNNSSTGATYYDTEYRTLVRDQAGTRYLRSDGTFAAWSAGLYTRTTSPHTVYWSSSDTEIIAVNGVAFDGPGVYEVRTEWWGSCGNYINNAVLLFPVGTALGSYADAGAVTPEEDFGSGATVYISGSYYLPSTGYAVAFYGPDGTLKLTQSVTSTSGGVLSTDAAAAVLGSDGGWHAVVYGSGTTPPSYYDASDALALSRDAFTVDTVAPVGPVITAPADGSSTTDTTPALTGTAEANSTVTLTLTGPGGPYTVVVAADGSGNFSVDSPLLPFGGPFSVSATATDAAGNTSPASAAHDFNVVHPAPTVENPITAGETSVSGTSGSPAGTIVTVYSGGTAIGTTTVQGDGTWTLSGVSGLAGGEEISATAGSGTAESAVSSAVIVTPAAPVISAPLVEGSTLVTGTSTAPPGSVIIVTVDGVPYTTTVQGDGSWSVTVPALGVGDSITVTVTANTATSAPAGPVVISGIPNLLRNDVVVSLAAYDPALIFTRFPGNPSMDGFGPDARAQIGEGALQEANGSSDDDDFYYDQVPSGYIDSDPSVLTDGGRPLVFYQLSCTGRTLYLTKEAGSIKITYTP